ncbi:MAG: phosphotransferase [Clostridia bacterium]|nr:phosphotransferase [Clostridia bacterium]
MEQEFKDRINLNTDLSNISRQICKQYELGEYISDTIITVGYEDFNYILKTSTGKYCVKVFNRERTNQDCKNYIDRIELASTLSINTPKLHKADDKGEYDIEFDNVKYRLCVFDYIDGESFYDLEIIPNEDEIKEIIRQMAVIHKATLKSDFIYDKWAIINYEQEMKDKDQYLNEEDKKKLQELLDSFKKVDMDRLPKAFVHGDIISTNVMKDKNNKLWIIDFAVSNYLPRVIDLAVSACNLCLDADSKENTARKTKMILDEYQKYNKLTNYEKEQFPIFFDIANAMGVLQISYLATLGETSEEGKFWYNESKQGLAFSDEDFWKSVFEQNESER